MDINLSRCQIIQPEGERLYRFYKQMWEIFPYDRPVYEVLMEEGNQFYPMKNYALYDGDTLLGNAGIFPFNIWMDAKWRTYLGIGAVATMKEFRRQGVASRLLKHCIALINEKNAPSVLFTELNSVYEPFSFKVVKQNYRAVKAEDLKPGCKDNFRIVNTLSGEDMASVIRLYSENSAEYNGKVMRDEKYWGFYRMMFNPYKKPEIVFWTSRGVDEGYVRYEKEADRLTITELICNPDNPGVIESLLSYLKEKSFKFGFAFITAALSPGHFIWKYLEANNISSFLEPEGVRRETFMMRPASGKDDSFEPSVFWSLSDKF